MASGVTPNDETALLAMGVSLTPALSQRARGTRSALRATFAVTNANER